MRAAYEKMHQAILKTGRPMVYSLCQYGFDSVWQWAPEVGGNMWRTTDDINATFSQMSLLGRDQAGLSKYAGPGHWNDPDMLEVGNGKFTLDEDRTHMGMWAISPTKCCTETTNSRCSEIPRGLPRGCLLYKYIYCISDILHQ